MKASRSETKFSLCQSESLFNIDLASYSLVHHHFSRHFHDHYVIELVVNGVDSFFCNGKNYMAQSNQLVLINPGEVHTGNTVSDIPLQYFSLYPDKKALQHVASSLEISLPGDFCFQRSLIDQSLLTRKFKSLFECFDYPGSALKQQELFADCMYELLKPGNGDSTAPTLPKDKRVAAVIDFIRAHYKEDLSLQQLADNVRLNPFHLARCFKKTVGLSPYDYLLTVRTEKAKQLLRKGHRVQDAAAASGFYDSSHLNRMFQKTTGTSPKSFRSSKSQYRTSLAW